MFGDASSLDSSQARMVLWVTSVMPKQSNVRSSPMMNVRFKLGITTHIILKHHAINYGIRHGVRRIVIRYNVWYSRPIIKLLWHNERFSDRVRVNQKVISFTGSHPESVNNSVGWPFSSLEILGTVLQQIDYIVSVYRDFTSS